MKQLKVDLRAKKEEWAEEEVERAKGGVRLVCFIE